MVLFVWVAKPSQSRLTACQLPQGGSFLASVSKLPSLSKAPSQRGLSSECETGGVAFTPPPREKAIRENLRMRSNKSPSGAFKRQSVLHKQMEGLCPNKLRRFSRIANYNKIPLKMPRVQRRRPPPAAEAGRSCWGSGQQDTSAAQGTKRMLGAATR